MKRMIFILAISAFPLFSNAQDFIDEIFNKYSGDENFTSIVISKNLIDFAFTADKANELNSLKGKISDLKILVSEKKNEASFKFTDEIRSNLNKNDFISLIEILEGKNKISFYVKKDNNKIVNLLLIASNNDQEVLLTLKGQFTMKELAELGKGANEHGSFHHLSYLKNLEK